MTVHPLQQVPYSVRMHLLHDWYFACQTGRHIFIGQCEKCGEPVYDVGTPTRVCARCGETVVMAPIWNLRNGMWKVEPNSNWLRIEPTLEADGLFVHGAVTL